MFRQDRDGAALVARGIGLFAVLVGHRRRERAHGGGGRGVARVLAHALDDARHVGGRAAARVERGERQREFGFGGGEREQRVERRARGERRPTPRPSHRFDERRAVFGRRRRGGAGRHGVAERRDALPPRKALPPGGARVRRGRDERGVRDRAEGRTQDRERRGVVRRIDAEAQQFDGPPRLGPPEEPDAARDDERHALGRKRRFERGRRLARPQEDRRVGVGRGPQALRRDVEHRRPLGDEPLQPRDGDGRLALGRGPRIGRRVRRVRGQREDLERRRRRAALRSAARTHRFAPRFVRRRVVGAREDPPLHGVHARHEPRRGAVVVGQRTGKARRLPVLRARGRRLRRRAAEGRDVAAAEREDRLLRVADEAQPRPPDGVPADEAPEDAPLQRVGVLKLVDEHVPERPRRASRRDGLGGRAVGGFEQAFEVVRLQRAEPRPQPCARREMQPRDRRRELPRVAVRRRRGGRIERGRVGQFREQRAGAPHARGERGLRLRRPRRRGFRRLLIGRELRARGERRLRVARGERRRQTDDAVDDALRLRRRPPARELPSAVERGGRRDERADVGPHLGVVAERRREPERRGGVLRRLIADGRQKRRQVVLDRPVDGALRPRVRGRPPPQQRDEDLAHARAPDVAQGAAQRGAVLRRPAALRRPVERLVDGRADERRQRAPFDERAGRRSSRTGTEPHQEPQAHGVDRADPRFREPRFEGGGARIARLAAAAQLPPHARPQLPRRLLRVGDGEHRVEIPIDVVERAEEPLGQHARLARSGPGRDGDGPVEPQRAFLLLAEPHRAAHASSSAPAAASGPSSNGASANNRGSPHAASRAPSVAPRQPAA